jgi:hypothetical protein
MNQIIQLNGLEADKIAEGYFIEICGFNRESAKDKPRTAAMIAAGMSTRSKLLKAIQLKAIVSAYGPYALQGHAIVIQGHSFSCKALDRIPADSVLSVYAYIVTAGDVSLPEASMVDQFYADAWGTAYVDAGRDLLQNWIQQDMAAEMAAGIVDSMKISETKEFYISDSFGPGYYGMDVTEIPKFFKILDGAAIGVTASEQSFMRPQKSCAGFFIAVNDPRHLPGEDCKSCLGGEKGCQFCRFNANKLMKK